MLVDMVKVRHWMNARKVTGAQVAAGLDGVAIDLGALLERDSAEIADTAAERLAAVLDIHPWQLTSSVDRELCALVRTAEQMRQTCRPIQRDGIHFYNYYTMAAPTGRVAPVILDIRCPADRLPALNNGHLEPAITVNLGPGDIHGRWGVELTPDTWRTMAVNRGDDAWIVGDSYVEPSYCPHSYSLASDQPARIISYTGAPPIAPLVEECDTWSPSAFAALLDGVGGAGTGTLLRAVLDRRGYDPESAARASDVPVDVVRSIVDGSVEPDLPTARALGRALAFDYRLVLPADREHDPVGKSYRSVEQSRATIRRFHEYTVASMAGAPHLTDLIGMFMRVDESGGSPRLDLRDVGETHYLVLSGSLTLWWRAADGSVCSAELGPDGSAWTGPYVAHGWTGDGALARLGSGNHLGYLDMFALSGTFAPRATLTRARRDRSSWGYDAPSGGSA